MSRKTMVQKYCDLLRPVQIWVPDTRHPDFVEECGRQSRLAARAEAADMDMRHFIDECLADVDMWTE